jgi:cellulase/cellobiase CelA1
VTSAEQFSEATKKLTTLSGINASGLTLPAYSITVLKEAGASSSSTISTPNASASPTAATSSTACAVTAAKTDDWGNGYTENLTIKNAGSAAISNWKLAFAFPGNQKIYNGWSATYHQSGTAVLAHPVSYDGTIAAGASATIGYSATYSGSDTPPTWYDLNGVRCN